MSRAPSATSDAGTREGAPAGGGEGFERLRALARGDKWFLSAGDGFIWAPPFPRWLHRPGFWDPAHIYHYALGPLYSVALVDGGGRADPLEAVSSDWRPDRLRVRWRAASGTELTERRYVLPGGRFCSAWTGTSALRLEGTGAHGPKLVAFTAVPGERVGALGRMETGVRWATSLRDRKDRTLDVGISLEAAVPSEAVSTEMPRVWCGALRSEGGAEPRWSTTPFVEALVAGGGFTSPGALALGGVSDRGWVHVAVAPILAENVAFVLTVVPEGLQRTRVVASEADPVPEYATRLWSDALASYPLFTCSDPWLERYFDYRAYGLHLNRIEGGVGRIPEPAVAEGPDYFHLPITYSAQCHMMETRWSADPAVARGSLLNFLAAQRDDGSLPGVLWVNHDAGQDFYHADWADAALAVDALHPDRDFLETAYVGLGRYADWLHRERDPEGSGMVTVVNHYETGQEYMSRYVAVDPGADLTEWEPRLRLKGVDVTVYAYQLLRGLAEMAARLGRGDEEVRWVTRAAEVGRAILDVMWDDDIGLFSDVDPATGERTGVKAAVCFYPLLTDLLDDGQVDRLLAHLTDPGTFATEFPLPSSSADDPLFSAEGLWKGKRHNCPWNGRVWPMTNSHVVEGLIRQWHRGRTATGRIGAHLLSRFVRMMYHDGDLGRPNSYEHYNPRSGHACVFRGIDDYQHSWVLDLLARGACGVEPGRDTVRIHPLPMGLEEARIRARLRGHQVDVAVLGETVEVRVDGARHRTTIGTPLEVAW